jgi:predicted SAM-dependent methyltransferase
MPCQSSGSEKARVRYLNLAKRWPFADGSVDVVYLSHVLEHLDKKVRKRALDESARVLKPRGVIRVA